MRVAPASSSLPGGIRPRTSRSRPGRSLSSRPPQADWLQFRGNPLLTGVAGGAPSKALTLRWTYEAGEPIDSSAAIADGTVYVGVGSGDLIAVDLASGKLRWKYSTGNLIGESSPAIAMGVVYIGDLGGLLHAVNASDGAGDGRSRQAARSSRRRQLPATSS